MRLPVALATKEPLERHSHPALLKLNADATLGGLETRFVASFEVPFLVRPLVLLPAALDRLQKKQGCVLLAVVLLFCRSCW